MCGQAAAAYSKAEQMVRDFHRFELRAEFRENSEDLGEVQKPGNLIGSFLPFYPATRIVKLLTGCNWQALRRLEEDRMSFEDHARSGVFWSAQS